MTEFRFLNKKQLEDFIQSADFYNLPVLPISRHRAISQINNPRSGNEDILLILLMENGRIVGYLGLLPDEAYLPDGTVHRFSWASCIWLDSSLRGRGLGKTLIEKAIDLCGKNIIMTEFVPSIRKIYISTNAFESHFIEGVRLYVRMDLHHILPPKKPLYQKLKPGLKLADSMINYFPDFFNKLTGKKLNPNWKLEHVTCADDEVEALISSNGNYRLFRRGKTEINWFLRYPWLLSAPEKDFLSERYYFSAVDKDFRYHCLKVRNKENQLVAFLVFSRRNNNLKLPYCFFKQEALEGVAGIINYYIRQWNITTFTTFHPELSKYYQENESPGLHKKKMRREYLIARHIFEKVKDTDFRIQDGDGDCAFT